MQEIKQRYDEIKIPIFRFFLSLSWAPLITRFVTKSSLTIIWVTFKAKIRAAFQYEIQHVINITTLIKALKTTHFIKNIAGLAGSQFQRRFLKFSHITLVGKYLSSNERKWSATIIWASFKSTRNGSRKTIGGNRHGS
jgi:hypothetical protein